MLHKEKIKAEVKAVFLPEMINEDDRNVVLDRIANRLSDVIIDSIKSAKINYTSGLTAPMGAVTGTFNHTIE